MEIVDAKHHKELIGDEFEVRNIIKTEKKPNKIMDKIKKERTSNPPKWFTLYMTEFERRNNARFEKIEKDIKKIFEILEKNNIK
jgi:hypothetical protein